MGLEELRRLLTDVEWQRSTFLFQPRVSPEPSAGMESVAVHTQLSDLVGHSWDLDTIMTEIAKIPTNDWIAFLTRIDQYLYRYSPHDMDAQRRVISEWCPPGPLKDALLRELKENCMVLFPQQLLAMMKLVLTCAPDNPAPSRGISRWAATRMWFTLLAITDHLTTEYQKDITDVGEERALLRESVRNMSLHRSEQLNVLAARYWCLLCDIPRHQRLRQSPDYLDMSALFQEHLGMSVKQLLAMGFAILTKFITHDDPLLTVVGVAPEEWLSTTCVPQGDVLRLLELLATKVPVQAVPEHWFYDYAVFRDRPLVPFEGGYVPVHVHYLQDKLTQGLFWLLNDQLPDGPLRKKFRRFFGQIVETYAQDVLERIYPASPLLAQRYWGEFNYGASQKSPDAIVSFGPVLVFVEVVASRPKYQSTLIEGSFEALDDDIRILVLEPAKQLNNAINAYRAGKFSFRGLPPDPAVRIIPVVVALDNLPQTFVLRRHVSQRLMQKRYFQQSQVERLEMLDMGDLEMLESVSALQGVSILEILDGRRSSTMDDQPLSTYLLSKYPSLPHSPFLRDLFDDTVLPALSVLLFKGEDGLG